MGFFGIISLFCMMLALFSLPFIAGIVILIVRSMKQYRTKKKYIPALVIGIVLILVGLPFWSLPIALEANDRAFGAIMKMQYQADNRYFLKYVETDETIEVRGYNIRVGFDFHGMHYSVINGMEVAEGDEKRTEAIANWPDDKKTVFKYDTDTGCDLLCIDNYIFCPDDQLDALDEYYRNQKLNYDIGSISSDDYTIEENEITDSVFFDLYDANPNVVTEYPGGLDAFYDRDSMSIIAFSVYQNSGDDELQRTIWLTVDADGTVYLKSIQNLYGRESWQDTLYQITDPSVSQYLADLVVEREEEA